MGALTNPRHERFAQEMAKGKSQAEALVAAGYRPNPSAASRLAADVKICERVAEIQERGALRAEVNIATLTADLLRLRDKGEALGDSAGLSVARNSVMDIAKLNGFVVDKGQLDGSLTFTGIARRIVGA